jgi:glycoprotein-N-acetylgalactosamine 3-beta-galactosyltransferase
MSTKNDTNIPEIVTLDHGNGRSNLWKKTRLALEYVYKNHFNDADWFLRADDDKFVFFGLFKFRIS